MKVRRDSLFKINRYARMSMHIMRCKSVLFSRLSDINPLPRKKALQVAMYRVFNQHLVYLEDAEIGPLKTGKP